MAITIKNMNLPKCCNDCELNYDSIGCTVTKRRFDEEEHFDEYYQRMKDCPLAEYSKT